MSLLSAISEVRAEIQSGSTLADAVSSLSVEYNLNPRLIIRKLCESHGVDESNLEGAIRQAKITQSLAAAVADSKIRCQEERAAIIRENQILADVIYEVFVKRTRSF